MGNMPKGSPARHNHLSLRIEQLLLDKKVSTFRRSFAWSITADVDASTALESAICHGTENAGCTAARTYAANARVALRSTWATACNSTGMGFNGVPPLPSSVVMVRLVLPLKFAFGV